MPNKPVPVAVFGLSLEAREKLDEVRLLVDALFMACADLDINESEPLRTLAQVIADGLTEVANATKLCV